MQGRGSDLASVVEEDGGPHVVASPVVDVVVPAYNEAGVLETNVRRLHAYLKAGFPFSWRITIADNASTDATPAIAAALGAELVEVRTIRLDAKGRGRALRAAWSSSDAAIVAYMDADLSTGLDALLPLVSALVSGHSDIAIGSRLAKGANVVRSKTREFVSRAYNLLLRVVFATRVRDAQCGFKALRSDVANRLLPLTTDDEWFFDTELLLLAEHNGLRIHEVAVDWVEDPNSSVRIARTALADLRGMVRLVWAFMHGRGRVDLGAGSRWPGGSPAEHGLGHVVCVAGIRFVPAVLVCALLRPVIGDVGATVLLVAYGGVVVLAADRLWSGSRPRSAPRLRRSGTT